MKQFSENINTYLTRVFLGNSTSTSALTQGSEQFPSNNYRTMISSAGQNSLKHLVSSYMLRNVSLQHTRQFFTHLLCLCDIIICDAALSNCLYLAQSSFNDLRKIK